MTAPEVSHKLLVVDDEPNNLDFVARVCRNGFSVLKAASGAEGMQLLRQHSDVAVIVADQRMPGMSGSEFLGEAYKVAPESMRVLMTGYAEFDAVVEAINRGRIWSYVSKPVAPDQLRRVIESCVEIYVLSARNRELAREMARNSTELAEQKAQLVQSLDTRTRELLAYQRRLEEVAVRYAMPEMYEHPSFASFEDELRLVRVRVDIPTRIGVLGEPLRESVPRTSGWERIAIPSERVGESFEGSIQDIADNTARIAVDTVLPLLSRVVLSFPLAGFGEATVVGLVVSRSRQSREGPEPTALAGGFGILFEFVPPDVRQAIVDFIHSKGGDAREPDS